MRTPLVLLKYVAKALGNAIGGGIAGDLVVEVLPEVAKDVWEWWGKDRTADQCRVEVEAVAQAGAEEVRQQVAEIVQEVIPDKPLEVRQAVETYMTQVPASIRRSLRRSSDPTGSTVPPDLVPRKADDLLRLLPPKLSRFKPGGHPLFGVDWELELLLGVGGFGEVWKARNPYMASVEPVALKFCLDPAAAKVLRNEAGVLDRVMRQGKHPGIVQLLRTYLNAETPCLEYEYVDGGDLTGLIQEWHRAKGGPTPQQATKVILRLAEIVGFAHRLNPPIVHRDLKPANILVQRTGDGEVHFKVADFGIGGVAVGQAIRETSRGTSRGRFLTSALHGSYTPLYASPQQMRGDPPDPRDDVYSLGVIWYQLLTGELANGRPGGSRWRKKLSERGTPSEMVDLLESCFEDNQSDRPACCDDLAHLLESSIERERQLELERQRTELERKRREQDEAERRQRAEAELAQLVQNALDRTHGKLSQQDTIATDELSRHHHISPERAKQIVEDVCKEWKQRETERQRQAQEEEERKRQEENRKQAQLEQQRRDREEAQAKAKENEERKQQRRELAQVRLETSVPGQWYARPDAGSKWLSVGKTPGIVLLPPGEEYALVVDSDSHAPDSTELADLSQLTYLGLGKCRNADEWMPQLQHLTNLRV
jgi:serine/threonine protein kinase